MRANDRKTALFLASVLLVTLIGTWLVLRALIVTEETVVISLAWVLGFGFLFFNISYLLHISLAYLFIRKPFLKEAFVKPYPKVALVYPIRNEEHGLLQRIEYSLEGNKLPGLDLWVLSDSDPQYEPEELGIVARLKEQYGERIHYRRRPVPFERKQGNLHEFLHSHPEYSYIYVCDADGTIPRGTILKLLRKAGHPANRDVAIFQCFVRITHARTWYARFERIGTYFAQKLNFTAIQALFRRSISFGHHQLVRAEALRKIRLPKGLLSHDNWDTVILDQMGWRVVFLPDVFAFDEGPPNYLEARARADRWAQGTLQGWPLIFKRGITLASRFLAFYGIYLYVSDIVFFAWVILGLFAHSAPAGELIHFEIDSIWLGLLTNQTLLFLLILSLAVTVFYKLVAVRTLREFGAYLYELFFSTLVTLNNFFYVPLSILAIPLRSLIWRPMKKNPFEEIDLGEAFRKLWSGTTLGLAGTYFCTQLTPYYVWQASPLLLSLSLSIFTVYFTAKAMPPKLREFV